jgi:hypothetical protein
MPVDPQACSHLNKPPASSKMRYFHFLRRNTFWSWVISLYVVMHSRQGLAYIARHVIGRNVNDM